VIFDSSRAKSGNDLEGRWRLAQTEEPLGDDVVLEFHSDGKLTYIIREGAKRQVMNLTYRVVGDTIVTDQPSQPKEEVTRFGIDADGTLVLEFGGTRSWFRRASD
jgi:hypothetical protein